MAHYTLIRLSDSTDTVFWSLVARTDEHLSSDIFSIKQLSECKLVDAKTGEPVRDLQLKKWQGVHVAKSLDRAELISFLLEVMKYHKQVVDGALEFAGINALDIKLSGVSPEFLMLCKQVGEALLSGD